MQYKRSTLGLTSCLPNLHCIAIFIHNFTVITILRYLYWSLRARESCVGSSDISDRSVSVLPEFFSNFVGRFLPTAFCTVVIYWPCVKRSLQGLRAQFEKTILWLGGCWVGTLSNYTFSWLHISRLTSHDLEQQPGAKLALAIIVIVLTVIVSQQIY
jgi:hypothetical protein